MFCGNGRKILNSINGIITPIARGIKVLELLSEKGPLYLDQISECTGIPRTSVFRILNTLEYLGYVEKEQIKNAEYWNLGLKILSLSNSKLLRMDVKIKIRDILENLAVEVDEFVQLGVLYKKKVMYIDQIKRQKPLTMYAEVGTQLPINVSAAGMVLASGLDEKQLVKLLNEEKFEKNTEKTIVEPEEIKEVIEFVKKNGYVVDDQQYAIGIRCIAAPVFDHTGNIMAAINITGTLSSITDEKISILVENVKSSAREASKRMGYIC